MSKRETTLAAVTGGLLVVVLVVLFFVAGGTRSSADMQDDLDAKTTELAKVDAEVAKHAGAAAKLTEWKKRSLPWDKTAAQNTYQTWLREACKRVNFDYKKAQPKPPRPIYSTDKDKREIGRAHLFEIKHDATLDQLTQFLYEFYSAGYLHKITLLNIAPATAAEGEKGDKTAKSDKTAKVSKENLKLTVKIDIEVLALKDAEPGDKSKLKPDRAPLEELSIYRKDPKGIVQRNLFAVYEPEKPKVVVREPRKPPEPPRKPPEVPKPPEFDHAGEGYITGIVEVNGRRQVWLDFRTTGDHFKRFEGESFQSEKSLSLRGKIVKINPSDVIVEFGGKLVRVDQNHSLREGKVLPQ